MDAPVKLRAMSIPAALARRRDYSGPAIFSYGFRPFFLGGAIWAAMAILIWIPLYMGALTWRSPLAPLDWHIHEMLYGYVPAVVAGFLLTAIPNWTGRLPVCGAPLAGLALVPDSSGCPDRAIPDYRSNVPRGKPIEGLRGRLGTTRSRRFRYAVDVYVAERKQASVRQDSKAGNTA